jgi:adenine-specific DNA-methyltransferase
MTDDRNQIITEGIKYTGSKLKLLPYIQSIVSELPNIHSVLDGFSGTTRVSQLFAQLGYSTHSNDLSVWSETFARCYLLAERKVNFYRELIDHLNNLTPYSGWFTENYGGYEGDKKKPFQVHNTQKLDAIRDEIDILNLSVNDKSVILTALILALDKVDSTLGHYASYLKEWSKRSYAELRLDLPNLFPITTNNQVTQKDIFNLLNNNSNDNTEYDLAYYDPPYGSNNEKMPASRVRYSAYYHLWKTVILNDKPKLFGKVGRRVDSKDTMNNNPFESFKKNENNQYIAMEAISRLVKQTHSHYILLSYSSGGRATKEELMDILSSNGKLINQYSIDYKKNVMANMTSTKEWASDTDNQEYLFLLEK